MEINAELDSVFIVNEAAASFMAVKAWAANFKRGRTSFFVD